MYKFTCQENECVNKNVIYYLLKITEQVMCGGCKTFNSAIEMSQAEFDEVFDYDPFAVTPLPLQ